MIRLVVCEKPSVARDLARVLGARGKHQGFIEGEGVRITWCVGHLAELENPVHYDERWKRWSFDTLPMLPERFALRPRKGAVDQWRVVRGLLRDAAVSEVVNACDAGREGELIFRYVYELAGCSKPVLRFWVSSLTDQAINQGWGNLRPGGHYDALADAARCRSESDWLVGLNATRAMTCLARRAADAELLSIGRVQTPTLAMIVERDLEIEAFVPEDFWQVKGTFTVDLGEAASELATWKATWFRTDVKSSARRDEDAPEQVDHAERIGDEPTAKRVAELADGQPGRVATSGSRRKTERPPLLYDLTSLQRRANQRYGLPAARTLEIAQSLYERHKILSYPRTDARFITPDQVAELPDIVRAVATLGPYATVAQKILSAPIQPGKRVVDASEVGDHHAILPTSRAPSPGSLSGDEKRVYDLVARRLLAALSEDAIYELSEIVVEVTPKDEPPDGISAPLCFRAKGRTVVQPGWRTIDPPPSRKKDTDLPSVPPESTAMANDVQAVAGQTRPPRRYTDASILRAMETAGQRLDEAKLKRAMRQSGLGTPATRANILQTLLNRKYMERQKKELWSTPRGRALIAAIPLDELKSPSLTGRWEARLSAMAEGREGREAFMRDVALHVRRIVSEIDTAEPPPAELVAREQTEKVLGDCPVCGKPVRERRPNYACDTGRSCTFVIWKKVAKRNVSARMVKDLLNDGKTKVLKGFKSRKGSDFEAGLVLNEDGTVGFWFPDRNDSSAPRKPAAPPPIRAGDRCPRCQVGTIIQGRSALGCGRWREGCDFRAPL